MRTDRSVRFPVPPILITHRTDHAMTYYTFGTNLPGYLPESEVFAFDSLDGALSAMEDDLQWSIDEWEDIDVHAHRLARHHVMRMRDSSDGEAIADRETVRHHGYSRLIDGRVWWIDVHSGDPDPDCVVVH